MGWRVSIALLASAACLALAACGDAPSTDTADDAIVKGTKVDVVATAALPIAEVSGLGRRRLGSKTQYIAVGDAEPVLVTFDVRDGFPSNVRRQDLSAVVGRAPTQWEAVAGDATGSVFVLAESSDQIMVIDPKLEKVTHTIELSVPKDHALAKDWKRDANSRGEGMLLLSNGHILVVKEKDPVALVEFAPGGEPAEGYRAELALGDRAFPLPRGAASTMVATHHWLLKDSDQASVTDVSDLAIEDDGRVLMLTDQGRGIVRVERSLRADEDKIDLKSVYRLPSSVDKPEGLVMAAGTPVVATDAKSPGETLFVIAPLP
jgi:hypothetical protein